MLVTVSFSSYDSRMPIPPFSGTTNAQADGEEDLSPCIKRIPDEALGDSRNVPRCNGTVEDVNTIDAESPSFGTSGQNGIAIRCSPVRVLPVPIHIGGLNFDRSAESSGHLLNPRTDSSGHFLWSTSQSVRQEAIASNASHQTDAEDSSSTSHHQKSSVVPSAEDEHQKASMGKRREPDHVPSAAGDNAGSSICQVTASHFDGRISNKESCDISKTNMPKGNVSTTNVSHAKPELRSEEQEYRLQREAALNKFRLKRKERCFEKKVHKICLYKQIYALPIVHSIIL